MNEPIASTTASEVEETPRARKPRTPREQGTAGKGTKPVNLRDVARLAGVSVATVSMVINDNPRISRATHMRVQRLIERLGYRPNRLAQSLSSKYTQEMAILLPALRHTFADPYFGELISGICDRAGKLGYKVILEQAKPEFVKTRQHIEMFERRHIDGILALGCNDRHHFLKDFSDGRYPLVVVDNQFSQWKLDYVMCDYRSGADQVMNYLLQLGHRQIGLINAAPEVPSARDVRDVYLSRLQSNGVTALESWMADGKFTEEGGAAAAQAILDRHPDVTALFAGNDKMALGALHHLTRQGIRVPQDISVVGFDDLKHASFITPSLTTVHLPLYEVGALACERLVERVHGNADKVAETLPTHLVMRESTALAKSVSSNDNSVSHSN